MLNVFRSIRERKEQEKMQKEFFGLADFSEDDMNRYLKKYAETFRKLGE